MITIPAVPSDHLRVIPVSAKEWTFEFPRLDERAYDVFHQTLEDMDAGEYGQAEQDLRLLIQGFPEFIDAYHAWGLQLLEDGSMDAALQVFKTILGLNPDDNQGIRALLQISSILSDELEAEELTQDVLLRIHRSSGGLREGALVSAWVWKITRNAAISWRRKRVLPTVPLDSLSEESVTDLCQPGPEEEFIEKERRAGVVAAIDQLPTWQAMAISLYYLEGMEYDEIGDVLNIPPGSVATAMHRGRVRLRQIIERNMKEYRDDL